MAMSMHELGENQRLADQINRDARTSPNSPYRGKFVGIAHGKVVAVADNLDALDALLEQAEPDASQTLWIEASADYEGPHYIWVL